MAGRLIEILTELHDQGVDFVIVGGVAAALHGGSRATFDLDIVPSLAPDSWQAAVDLLWLSAPAHGFPNPSNAFATSSTSAAGASSRLRRAVDIRSLYS